MNSNQPYSSLFVEVTEEEECLTGGMSFQEWQNYNQNSLSNGIPSFPQDSFWSDLLAIPIFRYLFSLTNPRFLQTPTDTSVNSGGTGFLGLW